jgi:NNP family nitrate/nitrite transporter-like MFS transporter
MNGGTRGFLRAGHLPTLVAALAYFDVSFMAWVLLGPLAPFLTDRFGLTPAEQGLLTAVPLLGGSIGRPLLGALGDRLGGRRAGLAGLALTLVPLVIGWQFVTAAWQLYAIGLLLGVAGASFAVALPLASRWYPREYQGLVMGIAGAGNSGTLLATLAGPRLAERYGWANAFGAAIIPVALVAVLFAILAKDAPVPAPSRSARGYRTVLAERDALWLAAFYGVTFGGFVGLASFLTVYFHEQYGLSRVAAGDFATVVVVAGSLLRPLGGWLSDRIGGYRLLAGALAGVALCLAAVATTPRVGVALALLFAGMGLLGMGNGAVFQVVPIRFPQHVGLVTGVVGAAGGLGGFFLPTMLGAIKGLTGSYGAGLTMAAVIVAAGLGILLELGRRWQRDWPSSSARLSGVFAYRRALPPPAAIVRSLGD